MMVPNAYFDNEKEPENLRDLLAKYEGQKINEQLLCTVRDEVIRFVTNKVNDDIDISVEADEQDPNMIVIKPNNWKTRAIFLEIQGT